MKRRLFQGPFLVCSVHLRHRTLGAALRNLLQTPSSRIRSWGLSRLRVQIPRNPQYFCWQSVTTYCMLRFGLYKIWARVSHVVHKSDGHQASRSPPNPGSTRTGVFQTWLPILRSVVLSLTWALQSVFRNLKLEGARCFLTPQKTRSGLWA
jgi:hypothetical protein